MTRYQAQFERCCGPAMKPRPDPKPLSGIAKEFQERAEAERMWSELKGER